jgi:predicted SAM-dependent methyltransferase
MSARDPIPVIPPDWFKKTPENAMIWNPLSRGWRWLFGGPYQPPGQDAAPYARVSWRELRRCYLHVQDAVPYAWHVEEPKELTAKLMQLQLVEQARALADLPVLVPALKKLNIGCGPNPLDGWVNVDLAPHSSDVARMDATGQFPWPNDTFSHVFSEHMIEHVELDGARNMIRECYRVLRPGGRIRIVTPDRDFLTALLKQPLSQLQRDYIHWSCHHFAPEETTPCAAVVVEFFPRLWGHQHIFDRGELWAEMCKSGFTEPVMCELRESPDPELCDLENEARMPPGFLRLESMIIEAVKPNA